MEKILGDFGVNWILLSAQIVNFLVLLFILKKLLYKPVLKMLDERKRRIVESLENAEKITQELAETQEIREREIAKGIEESKKIIAEATANGNQIIADSQAKAKQEYDNILEQGVQMILGEKEKMKNEVKSEVAQMLEMSLEKVLGKALDPKSHQKLVEESIKTIKS